MEQVEAGMNNLRPALQASYELGRSTHPAVLLAFEPFAERLLVAIEARANNRPAQQLIEETPPGDFYLASACELDCPAAWDRLVEVCGPRVRAMALSWGASPADADEIAAGLPGELLQPSREGTHATRVGGYTGAGSLLAWVGRIVDRRLADRRRRRRPATNDRLDATAAPANTPSDAIIHTETGERVSDAFENAIKELAPRDFEILVLLYHKGLPQRAVAERLGVTAPRISFLNERIVSRVRKSMVEAVPDETAAYWLSREGLAIVLKDAISRILDRDR